MRRSREDRETEAHLLWDFVAASDRPHRCAVRDALRMTDADISGHRRFLRDDPDLGEGRDVILPGGMSKEPHEDPATGDPCQCGRLELNYKAEVAHRWYKRRLVTLRGHANDVEATGQALHDQFPDSAIMLRLLADARRLREDVELALAWMSETNGVG